MVNLVTGKHTPRYCNLLRERTGSCGPDAKLFEARGAR
jgi:hypothetical protein